MKLSALKEYLGTVENFDFHLPNGEKVPQHFHITEIGLVTKKFVDCGGILREEQLVSFQLWYSNDFDHRINSKKLQSIIAAAESKLTLIDEEIEVEYQSDTIGKYGLELNHNQLKLTIKMTDCLAPDRCNIPQTKKKINLSDLVVQNNSCTPGSGCC